MKASNILFAVWSEFEKCLMEAKLKRKKWKKISTGFWIRYYIMLRCRLLIAVRSNKLRGTHFVLAWTKWIPTLRLRERKEDISCTWKNGERINLAIERRKVILADNEKPNFSFAAELEQHLILLSIMNTLSSPLTHLSNLSSCERDLRNAYLDYFNQLLDDVVWLLRTMIPFINNFSAVFKISRTNVFDCTIFWL